MPQAYLAGNPRQFHLLYSICYYSYYYHDNTFTHILLNLSYTQRPPHYYSNRLMKIEYI